MEEEEAQMRRAKARLEMEKAELELANLRSTTPRLPTNTRDVEDDEGPIGFDEPPNSYLSSVTGSAIVKKLEALAPEARRGYKSATKSYEIFCMLHKLNPWPASIETL